MTYVQFVNGIQSTVHVHVLISLNRLSVIEPGFRASELQCLHFLPGHNLNFGNHIISRGVNGIKYMYTL